MRAFIDDLLRYSQSTHAGSDVRPLDLEAVLSEALSSLGAAIEESGAKITHDSLPVLITDARIEQVLQNLISNAIKYRRKDVAAGDPCCRPNWRAMPGIFSVRDNGIGIEPQIQTDHIPGFPPLAWQGYSGHRRRSGAGSKDRRNQRWKNVGGIGTRRRIHFLLHDSDGRRSRSAQPFFLTICNRRPLRHTVQESTPAGDNSQYNIHSGLVPRLQSLADCARGNSAHVHGSAGYGHRGRDLAAISPAAFRPPPTRPPGYSPAIWWRTRWCCPPAVGSR